jgi:ankyrin repeat protein
MNSQDKIYGLTPLHLAVLSGNGKIVKKLLIRGANRNTNIPISHP